MSLSGYMSSVIGGRGLRSNARSKVIEVSLVFKERPGRLPWGRHGLGLTCSRPVVRCSASRVREGDNRDFRGPVNRGLQFRRRFAGPYRNPLQDKGLRDAQSCTIGAPGPPRASGGVASGRPLDTAAQLVARVAGSGAPRASRRVQIGP